MINTGKNTWDLSFDKLLENVKTILFEIVCLFVLFVCFFKEKKIGNIFFFFLNLLSDGHAHHISSKINNETQY